FGYGRLDVLARHRNRLGGDDVARPSMMLHAPLLALALLALACALGLSWAGRGTAALAAAATGVTALAGLCGERLVASPPAHPRGRDPAAWLFLPVHLLRDLAW